jgi:choline dehydrogenase-like flavoprotein
MPADAMKALGPFPWNRLGALTARYHIYLMCIAHEAPNWTNHVNLAAGANDQHGVPITRVEHDYSLQDLAARAALARQAGRILRQAGGMVRLRIPVKTFSHAVGTCRFGDDPERAVLDRWCRFFGLKNLYVVDGSFMPTAGAVNPSLTIAANALRVGHHLARDGWA